MNKPINKLTILALFAITGSTSFSMNHPLSLTSAAESKAQHEALLDELDYGIDLFNQEQYGQAMQKLLPLSEKSKDLYIKAEALVFLGDILSRGDATIAINYAKAKGYLEKALLLTKKPIVLAHAYLILGNMYARGDKTLQKDMKNAVKYFAQCASCNDPDTKIFALMELETIGTKEIKVKHELKKEAEVIMNNAINLCGQGKCGEALLRLKPLTTLTKHPYIIAKASLVLGVIHYKGDNITKRNFTRAKAYFKQALDAANGLDTNTQRFTKHALRDECCLHLGCIYAQGDAASPINIEKARYFLARCVKQSVRRDIRDLAIKLMKLLPAAENNA
jgi:TPR repeat protein